MKADEGCSRERLPMVMENVPLDPVMSLPRTVWWLSVLKVQ